jgi:single-stranded DNA-binding protein
VAVVGKLRLNERTTKDGECRSRLQEGADAVQFLDKPALGGAAPENPRAEPRTGPAVAAYRRKAS